MKAPRIKPVTRHDDQCGEVTAALVFDEVDQPFIYIHDDSLTLTWENNDGTDSCSFQLRKCTNVKIRDERKSPPIERRVENLEHEYNFLTREIERHIKEDAKRLDSLKQHMARFKEQLTKLKQ